MDIPLIHRFEKGYEAGAQSVNPQIHVIENYVGVTDALGTTRAKARSCRWRRSAKEPMSFSTAAAILD